MILSDVTIRERLKDGSIVIDPLGDNAIQPSSVDLRLSRWFRVFRNHTLGHIDVREPAMEDLTELIDAGPEKPFILHPGEFVLGSTVERVQLPNDVVGRLEGKALALDTPIPTPTGWTTMGELRVGDFVIGSDGNPVEVVGATDILWDRRCYRIVFRNGTEVVADAQHQWVTQSKSERRHGKDLWSVKTTEQLAERPRVGSEINHRVQSVAIRGGYVLDLPVDPYVLGVWLGDGTASSAEVTLGASDADEIIGEMRRRGTRVGRGRVERGAIRCRLGGTYERRRGADGAWASDDSLNSTLRKMGLLGNKHIPEQYLRAAYDQRLDLLRGLLDTDGYINQRGDQVELTFTNAALAEGVAELVASLGVVVTRDERPAKLNGRVVGTAYRSRFAPAPEMFLLGRRRSRVSQRKNFHGHGVAAVEQTASVPVRCIEVAAEDGIFLATKSFIPTHNSSLGRLGLLIHSTAGFVDAGWDGTLTLELSNVANLPITLYPDMKIGQISFIQMTTPAENPYGAPVLDSKYHGQFGPVQSAYWRNFKD